MKPQLDNRTRILPERTEPRPANSELKTLIPRALKLGWLKRSTEPKLKTESYLRRETRAQWQARGLTSRGHPRKNIPRPELAGLNRKTYHREYMRLWRNKVVARSPVNKGFPEQVDGHCQRMCQ
jgi:hypothetical protein